MINISYIRLKKNIVDDYKSTKKNWHNKMVNWSDLPKVMGDSRVQYSMTSWRNGVKTAFNLDRSKQDALCWDIDDGMTIPEFQKMFKKFKYILGTTKSNMIEKKGKVCQRFRVIVPAINIPDDNDVYFRMMELLAPFNDEQTLTGTASFLGHNEAITIMNEGKMLDCHKASLLAKQQLDSEVVEKASIDVDLMPSYSNNTLEVIKEQLTFEIVVDILESVGYEVKGNKFKLRNDESTASATISYKTLGIKDYGSDYFGDVIDVLVTHQGMSFRQALQYVSKFI